MAIDETESALYRRFGRFARNRFGRNPGGGGGRAPKRGRKCGGIGPWNGGIGPLYGSIGRLNGGIGLLNPGPMNGLGMNGRYIGPGAG